MLLNAGHNIIDILAIYLITIFKALKPKGIIEKLRDLFNFINSRRDATCDRTEFKSLILERLELGK